MAISFDAKHGIFHGKTKENKVNLFAERNSVYIWCISDASNLVQIGSRNSERDSLKSPC